MARRVVVSNEPAATLLRRLVFDGPIEGYDRPGQYVVATPPGHKPGYFAIAGLPGEPLELLIKVEGDAASALAALAPGDDVEIDGPRGQGFPLDRIAGRPLVVLVNGSGISAARAVIRAEIAAGLSRPVRVYYGVLDLDRQAYADELPAWRAAGVEVTTVLDAPAPGWEGPIGFVQDVALADGVLDADIGAVLVGVPRMLEQAKSVLRACGVPDAHVLVNF